MPAVTSVGPVMDWAHKFPQTNRTKKRYRLLRVGFNIIKEKLN